MELFNYRADTAKTGIRGAYGELQRRNEGFQEPQIHVQTKRRVDNIREYTRTDSHAGDMGFGAETPADYQAQR
jgi:hypothetical protein